ncbi:hypothetical protein CCR85_00005, partial [Rhodothalassium salexigens]|uniref:TonB-dependent receptor n=1 Tax=Rhodothalassium salexigens TaxID=1086 RepID=UPI0019120944
RARLDRRTGHPPARPRLGRGILALMIPLAAPAQAQSPGDRAGDTGAPRLIEEIVITAERLRRDRLSVAPMAAPSLAADTAAALDRVPGGAVNALGPLSGQVQLRGLSSTRLAVRVDGQAIASGGPNLMDPPLHYAPRPLVDRLEVVRGIAPVSAGPGLGGAVDAKLKRSHFADDDADRGVEADLTVRGQSVDRGFQGGGMVALSERRYRAHVLGSYERGGAYRFPDGRVRATRYQRASAGLGGGVRVGDDHRLGAQYRYVDTATTGTPALGSDIRFFHTHLGRADYAGQWGGWAVAGRVDVGRVDHGMANTLLRPDPGARARRSLPARSRSLGYKVSAAHGLGPGRLTLGIDGDRRRHDLTITNPANPGFRVASFVDARVRQAGAFADYAADAEPVHLSAGLRVDHWTSDAGAVAAGPALPAPVKGLAAAFNAQDRRRTDTEWVANARLGIDLTDSLTGTLAGGRQTRAPLFVERYAWLPLPVSGGLADGNIYVGDVDLTPEVAHTVEGGLDWATERVLISPRAYARWVDGFIQGVPVDATPGLADSPIERIAAMNGDPTPLRFANVPALFYGLDAQIAVKLGAHWLADAVVGYVRAKRRDVDEPLYRIQPARATLGLTYERGAWTLRAEGVLVARQTRVSRTLEEPATAGYALVNLSGQWRANDRVAVRAGVENLTDRRYDQHLAGFNRVAGSDVDLGARLPGRGRGGFVEVQWTY